MLRQANLPCSSEREVERMMRMLDADGGGSRISLDKFRRFVCLLPASQVRAGTVLPVGHG